MVELSEIFVGSREQLKYPEEFEKVDELCSVEGRGLAQNLNLRVRTENHRKYELTVNAQIVYSWVDRFKDQIPNKTFEIDGEKYDHEQLFPQEKSPFDNRQLNDVRVKVLFNYVHFFVCPEKCELIK